MPVKKITPDQWGEITRLRYAGATQGDVAARFGVSKATISYLEQGNKAYKDFAQEFYKEAAIQAAKGL